MHILLGFLAQAYFYQGSGEDSDHVIKEAVAGEGDGNIRAGLLDLNGFNGADCGLFAAFNGAEGLVVMGSGELAAARRMAGTSRGCSMDQV